MNWLSVPLSEAIGRRFDHDEADADARRVTIAR